ncbi:hypothetical protein PSTG_00945 [Puccinia striiformis f. sp. tritici PST-78]|uniref:Uncharacterized protein n=1 Tax=Puccinia striiformis f. sp. tritici PST-78 TaxID=1165861 RepID=A0A0L0W3A3_9BASI|nr:hypothetical protein PSTG_00945 [Puccinia striiformis f. sp. tritici PST-78]
MHCLYYMISEGKQCVMVGFVELFTFVKSLKEDWNAVIKGVAISYGTQKQKDVGLSMGQAPKQRGQNAPVNDGRPPDTTDALVDKRSAKLGRPVGSTNHDKNQFSTYPLYHTLQDKPAQKNRCWLAAGLETLYALFSPLWLCGISGAGKDIFSAIVLTRAQGKIHGLVNEKYPGSFPPGLFASCDFFLEISLDPKLHKSPFYKQLFQYNTHRTFTCEMSPKIEQKFPDCARRSHHVITVSPALFDKNKIPYSNVPQLFDEWEKQGLVSSSGLVCKACPTHKPAPKPKKSKQKVERIDSEVDLVLDHAFSQQSAHHLVERSQIDFLNPSPPLHLNIHLEVPGEADWGYWTGRHYYCKVLCTTNQMTGVWLHSNGNNAGYAQLVNQVPSAIAGVHKETSWLMYSRVWTADEESHVEEAIKKIQQDHPNPSGDLPFVTLKSILNSSHNTVNTPYEASSVVAKIPEDSQKREVGPNNIMFNVLEADLADSDEQYEEDEGGITQTQIAAKVSNEEDALSNEEDASEDTPDSLPHIKEMGVSGLLPPCPLVPWDLDP